MLHVDLQQNDVLSRYGRHWRYGMVRHAIRELFTGRETRQQEISHEAGSQLSSGSVTLLRFVIIPPTSGSYSSSSISPCSTCSPVFSLSCPTTSPSHIFASQSLSNSKTRRASQIFVDVGR